MDTQFVTLPQDLVDSVFDLLEKSAAECDQLEGKLEAMARDTDKDGKQAAAAPPAPVFNERLLDDLCDSLCKQGLAEADATPEKLAEEFRGDPNKLAFIALSLVRPVSGGGRAYKGKSAGAPEPSQGGVVVEIGGHQVVDNDGWVSALT